MSRFLSGGMTGSGAEKTKKEVLIEIEKVRAGRDTQFISSNLNHSERARPCPGQQQATSKTGTDS